MSITGIKRIDVYAQRIAIRRRLREQFRANHRARAGPVVHYHLLAEHFAEFSRHLPAQYVGPTAGRHRNDQTQWFRGVFLRVRRSSENQEQECEQTQQPA